MKRYNSVIISVILTIITVWSCTYRKGDIYSTNLAGDSLNYVVMSAGKGRNISKKAADLNLNHKIKGNSCQIRYLSDSAALNNQQGILLIHTALPDIENDMLTGGFMGTLGSKQNVSVLIVADQDFDTYFQKAVLEKKR